MSVGERIVSLRKTKGWTQAKLAEASGLSASAIAMYETNRRRPDQKALERLASVFDVNTDAFLLGPASEETIQDPAPKTPATGLTTLTLSKEEARFILFVRMNPRAQSFLQSYMLADESKRQQLERTWRLIHDFQS